MDQDYESLLNSRQLQQINLYYLETKPDNDTGGSIREQQKYRKVLLIMIKTWELAISVLLLLFSILVYYYYSAAAGPSSLQQYSNAAYNTCNFSAFILLPAGLLSRALDRKYMFLLCNGILVFLAGYPRPPATSSSSSSSAADPHKLLEGGGEVYSPDHHNHDQVRVVLAPHDKGAGIFSVGEDDDHISNTIRYEEGTKIWQEEDGVKDGRSDQSNVFLMKDIDEVRGSGDRRAEEEEEDYDVGVVDEEEIAGQDGSREEEDDTSAAAAAGSCESELNNHLVIREGVDYQEGELSRSSSITDTDEVELNSKFEEFIRKMKQELKLEAQQQEVIAA